MVNKYELKYNKTFKRDFENTYFFLQRAQKKSPVRETPELCVIQLSEYIMNPLNLTPEQVASKVRNEKPTEMSVFPLLFSFNGRIGRRQFLTWYVSIWLAALVISIFDLQIAVFFNLLTLWPLFSLTTKRYHDFGSAGWFGLFQLLPGIGGLMIVFAGCGLTIGNFNDNRYGKSIYRRQTAV